MFVALNLYRKPLLALFDDLNCLKKNPKNVALCFAIQEQILKYLMRIESKIRVIKKDNHTLNDQIKNYRLSKEDVKICRDKIQYNNHKKESYDYLMSILRDIGDGVAFIYLSKWDIKPLVFKETTGFISGNKGLRLELKKFRFCKSQKAICIFNDITNSLRYGDLTLPGTIPYIIELKAGVASKNSKRAQRQAEALRKVRRYLVTDQTSVSYNGQQMNVQRRELTVQERHHRLRLTNLLIKAYKLHKNIVSKIEDGLYYGVIIIEEEIKKELNKLPKEGNWYIIFANREKNSKTGYVPFTLSIGYPEALFDFYSGQCVITTYIDLNVLKRKFNEHRFNFEHDINDGFFILTPLFPSEISRVQLSGHFFSRLGSEFLSMQWMIEELTARSTGIY